MSDGADRREARRFNMTLPLRVIPPGPHRHELAAQTRDVSYRGLYFLAESNFAYRQRNRIRHHSARARDAIE